MAGTGAPDLLNEINSPFKIQGLIHRLKTFAWYIDVMNLTNFAHDRFFSNLFGVQMASHLMSKASYK